MKGSERLLKGGVGHRESSTEPPKRPENSALWAFCVILFKRLRQVEGSGGRGVGGGEEQPQNMAETPQNQLVSHARAAECC